MPETKLEKKVVLIILDGWGVAEPSQGNAMSLAKAPFFSKITSSYFATTLQASGLFVGLPWGECGNSEVGHLNLGAGKIIYQTLPLIDKAINEGVFFTNEQFLKAIDHAKKNNSKLHLFGLVSHGGVHSSSDHLFALLKLCQQKKFKNVFIHAILDGRDSPRDSGLTFIKELEQKIKEIGVGKIATLMGRFYAMDRDNHWERIEKAYQAMVEGMGPSFKNAEEAINQSYKNNIFDEEFEPVVIKEKDQPTAVIENNDAMIFFNFRADRARQISKAFVTPELEKFKWLKKIENLFFVAMTEYEEGLPINPAFFPDRSDNPIAKIISEQGLRQMHIAETEKYAHVTYFFNGGKEQPNQNEDWVLVPSPRISSYDKKPEMSAKEITEKIVIAINAEKYNFIVANFANADMVGHTGNMEATVRAIEFLDQCLAQIIEAALKKNNAVLITADHGNAEDLLKLKTGEIDKEHSSNPVPFILIGQEWEQSSPVDLDLSLVQPVGVLADVAPTALKIMGIDQPQEMNGSPLI